MLKRLQQLFARHWAALGYVFGVIIPIILRTGRRPVIFTRDVGMGDIICSIPAVQELRKRHPGAFSIYNCHPDFMAIPRLYGCVDHVTSFQSVGLVNHWYRFLLAGYYQFSHGDPLVVRTAVKNFSDQFGVITSSEHLPLVVSAALKERAKSILTGKNLEAGALITIHTGPTLPVKEWPRESWTGLVALLRERGFTQIAQLGAGYHPDQGKMAVEPIPGTISLLDELSLEESVGVISLARLHIGIDSGLLHVAAAVGVPGVGIFGFTLPEFLFSENYRRSFVASQIECRGCAHRNAENRYTTTCPNNIRCMQEITPQEVLAACLELLQPAVK